MYVFSHTGSTYVKSAEARGNPAPANPGDGPANPAPANPGDAPADPAPANPGDPDARPRTKAGQREATTRALIDAARQLFGERGYAAVGTEDIVQLAGVTRGALYHHFKHGKEELFRAVLVQLSAETVRGIAAAAAAPGDPWQALMAGADAFLDACATPEVQRIMLVDGPSVLGWDVRRAIDSDYGLGLLEQALQRAIDAGAVLPGSPSAVAHVLTGALDEAAMVVARAEDPAAAREEMGRTIRHLLEGLRGPAA